MSTSPNIDREIAQKPLGTLEMSEKYILCLDYLKEVGYSDEKIAIILGIARATLHRQREGKAVIKLPHWLSLKSHLQLLAKAKTYLEIMG